MSAVLVTGGAGYIGSHVCKALAEAGLTPVCYDTLEKGHRWAVRWGPLEQGDIGDAERLDEAFGRHKPRAIVHLAGYIEVGESVREPERYLHNNATKTAPLIDAAMRHGVEAFVFSSTCAVYGVPQSELLSESHAIAPLSPYAESKARVETALTQAASGGLRAASLRYFNAAGADAGGEIGEAHQPETHLLPLAVDAALGLAPPLTLLGTDYPTVDGSCVRDFIHVSDLADAHVRALHWLRKQPASGLHEAFNLGSGSGFSVRQAIAETARIGGRPLLYERAPIRPHLSTGVGQQGLQAKWLAAADADLEPVIAAGMVAQDHHVGEDLPRRVVAPHHEEHQHHVRPAARRHGRILGERPAARADGEAGLQCRMVAQAR